MELIPNIRFHTAILLGFGIPMLIGFAVFQPSDTAVKVIFGLYVVITFSIGMRHSVRQERKRQEQKQSQPG